MPNYFFNKYVALPCETTLAMVSVGSTGHLGLRAVDGVFPDEMFYKQGNVGGNYAYAPKFERAICEDTGNNKGDRVIFLAAKCTESVLPILHYRW